MLRFGMVTQAAASVPCLPDDVLPPGSSEDCDTPGRGKWPAPGTRWQELSKSECFGLLTQEHLGQVAFVDDPRNRAAGPHLASRQLAPIPRTPGPASASARPGPKGQASQDLRAWRATGMSA